VLSKAQSCLPLLAKRASSQFQWRSRIASFLKRPIFLGSSLRSKPRLRRLQGLRPFIAPCPRMPLSVPAASWPGLRMKTRTGPAAPVGTLAPPG
jgi:hypothetical protein